MYYLEGISVVPTGDDYTNPRAFDVSLIAKSTGERTIITVNNRWNP